MHKMVMQTKLRNDVFLKELQIRIKQLLFQKKHILLRYSGL